MVRQVIDLPDTYASLPVQHIRIANHPANAPGVTPIQVVTLYRPDAHNAFTSQMEADMVLAWSKFDLDDCVKAIVVTGHGRMFCAGADLQTGFKRPDNDINGHRDG
jgi:enoyl-CoA hydratase/carnithine racemase